VAEEQDGNFISRLHGGDLAIVPWPMMSSPAFYHTFDDIKKLLLSRPVVHSTGGEFLGVLKMLMAQIQVMLLYRKILELTCLKASDWRSIESEAFITIVRDLKPLTDSLGSQRAKLLLNHLPNALKYGRTDLSGRGLTVRT
jgi:hypothetical protein